MAKRPTLTTTANRERPITAIALHIGFSETSTFTAAFHRLTAKLRPAIVAISIEEVGEGRHVASGLIPIRMARPESARDTA
jgi:hypothetical protein